MRLEMQGQRGFTILELMLVVLLVSIALAVIYPSLSRGTAAVYLRTSSRDVLNSLRYAREKAITEQVTVQLAFDGKTGKVALLDEFGTEIRSFHLPGEVRFQRLDLVGTEITEGPMILRFLPNGSSVGAEIELISRTGATIKVVTDPVTGSAKVLSDRNRSRQ